MRLTDYTRTLARFCITTLQSLSCTLKSAMARSRDSIVLVKTRFSFYSKMYLARHTTIVCASQLMSLGIDTTPRLPSRVKPPLAQPLHKSHLKLVELLLNFDPSKDGDVPLPRVLLKDILIVSPYNAQVPQIIADLKVSYTSLLDLTKFTGTGQLHGTNATPPKISLQALSRILATLP